MTKKNDVIEVETVLVDVQARKLLDRVGDYLTEKDWNFSRLEDRDCLTFNLRLRDASVRVFVDTWEAEGWSRILVYTTYLTYVPAQRRQAVAEAIARINYVNILGNLEMDMNDGEVRVRTTLEGDLFIGDEIIDRAIRKSLDLADQYQAPLLSIAFGNASPQDVVDLGAREEGAMVQ
jgi:hypothetical protein